MVLALWSRDKLADDSAVTDTGGWGGVTLAYNVASPTEVDALLATAGCRRHDRPARGPHVLGRLLGIFIDPDGHPWEVRTTPAGSWRTTAACTCPRREGRSADGLGWGHVPD